MGRTMILLQRYISPCGEMVLGSFNGQLCISGWTDNPATTKSLAKLCRLLDTKSEELPSPVTSEAVRQLEEYFRGKRTNFNIPLLLTGTVFQKEVWQRILEVPYGTTLTYSRLASLAGNPCAYRAASNACAANAIPIFVPCHRIVGSGCTLNGYNGGVARKRYLLALETHQ